eukprot:SAG31_NODE_3226_length_4519_cov_1.834163_3_plen_73_part_00
MSACIPNHSQRSSEESDLQLRLRRTVQSVKPIFVSTSITLGKTQLALSASPGRDLDAWIVMVRFFKTRWTTS